MSMIILFEDLLYLNELFVLLMMLLLIDIVAPAQLRSFDKCIWLCCCYNRFTHNKWPPNCLYKCFATVAVAFGIFYIAILTVTTLSQLSKTAKEKQEEEY